MPDVDDAITCAEFVELITDYFEGALVPRTLSRVEEHLVMCDWCVTYAEQMRTTIAALQTLHDPPGERPSHAVIAALGARRR